MTLFFTLNAPTMASIVTIILQVHSPAAFASPSPRLFHRTAAHELIREYLVDDTKSDGPWGEPHLPVESAPLRKTLQARENSHNATMPSCLSVPASRKEDFMLLPVSFRLHDHYGGRRVRPASVISLTTADVTSGVRNAVRSTRDPRSRSHELHLTADSRWGEPRLPAGTTPLRKTFDSSSGSWQSETMPPSESLLVSGKENSTLRPVSFKLRDNKGGRVVRPESVLLLTDVNVALPAAQVIRSQNVTNCTSPTKTLLAYA